MKTILNFSIVTLFFLQISIGQETNYAEITQIVVGDNYSDKDVQIITEEIENSRQRRTFSKLAKTKKYVNSTVEINGREINKSCSDYYRLIHAKEDLVDNLYDEIQLIKKNHKEAKPSNSQIDMLNKKVLQFNSLNKEHNINIDNYKMCLMSHREVRDDYNRNVKKLYEAYAIKKSNLASNNENDSNDTNNEDTITTNNNSVASNND